MRTTRGEFAVFCMCSCYKGKPHHVGTGICSGIAWAMSARLLHDQEHCADCVERGENMTCSCTQGTESLDVCEVYREAKGQGFYPDYIYPVDIESTFKSLEEYERV